MDNLLFRFDSTAELDQRDGSDPNRTRSKFESLFKNTDKLSKSQQQRRNELLYNRLSERDKRIASFRKFVSEVASDDDHQADNTRDENHTFRSSANINSNQGTANFETTATNRLQLDSNKMNDDDSGASTHQSTASPACASLNNDLKNKTSRVEDRRFRNKAMLSEWLVDRPMDFESDWLLKATPIGKRCLVFARKGETVAYSRKGQFIKAFQSSLPGGSRSQIIHCRRLFAIVDCIYVQHTNTFYLMDALAWNEHKLYESEASFRFFWLQSRYNESQDKFLTVNSRNECRFFCLQTYSASDQDILTAANSDPLIKEHNLQLDGLLFFHTRGPYVPGANPLVLWIKPDMVTRVLNLSQS